MTKLLILQPLFPSHKNHYNIGERTKYIYIYANSKKELEKEKDKLN